MLFRNANSIDDEDNTKRIDMKKLIVFFIIIASLILMIVLIISLFNNSNSNKPQGRSSERIVKNDTVYYLELLGDSEISLYQGDVYIDPGYIGSDNKGNDLTVNVLIDGNIDMNTVGSYKLTYTLGNVSKERIINVVERPVGATTIHLRGDVTMYLNVGEEYQEAGYIVIDTVDGDSLKDKVQVTSNVNTSKAGTYQVVYSVVNSAGVTTSARRVVVVMDSDISASIEPAGYTNKEVKINIYINDNYFDYMILPNNERVYEKNYTYKVDDNGSYRFLVYNKKGNSKEKIVTISSIDREAPTGSCSGTYKNGVSNIKIEANDNIGISRYTLDDENYTDNEIEVNREIKTAKIKIYDKAGNSTEISCNLTNKNSSSTTKTTTTTKATTTKKVTTTTRVQSSSNSSSSSKSSSSSSRSSSSSSSYSRSSSGGGSSIGDLGKIYPGYQPKYKYDNISVNWYKNFSYWAYIPSNATKNMPIIIYLPGAGEKGNDYNDGTTNALAWGPLHEVIKYGYSYRAIILHLQVPYDVGVYGYTGSYIELVNKIADEFSANKRKISVIGFSHGCYGTLHIVQENPRYFASAVMVGCGDQTTGGMNSYVSYFVNTATWAFVGSGDGSHSMPSFVDGINNSGGYAKYNRISGQGHNLFNDSYSILRDDNLKVMDWIISQNRK